MNEPSLRILDALRDVKGVEGSLYASRDGVVLARDLPRIYDDEGLEDVALRMGRILEALGDVFGTSEGTLVRYAHHAIFVRSVGRGLLGILATSDVNVPALKRGASLVARRLPPDDEVVPAASYSSRPQLGELATPRTAVAVRETAARESTPPPLPAPILPPPLPEAARVRAATPSERAAAPVSAPRISVPGAPVARPTMVPSAQPLRWRGTRTK